MSGVSFSNFRHKSTSMRFNPKEVQVEIDFSLDFGENYDDNVVYHLRITKQTLVSKKVPLAKGFSIGILVGNQKGKLTDMLGPEWSKEELKCFYEPFRKYGKDWKKVAGVVGNISTKMVEALYDINRVSLILYQQLFCDPLIAASATKQFKVQTFLFESPWHGGITMHLTPVASVVDSPSLYIWTCWDI
ncbi:hypothetical protein C5167_049620 [Papaver somniferum]|uniref:Myb-like domain-containing protein n=1 Tax=Papaver somniferum TaxID=3469 RepID=A0A4Y7KLB5_PAPSO|nr:hypothetical protein C5167_049620 [Papaver somniferum]